MKEIGRVYLIIITAVFLTLLFTACGTVASVTPLGSGKSSITLSSGGPVAPVFDIKMPIPYSVLRYRHGISDNIDIHVGLHPTMYILGNITMDIGVTRHLRQPVGWIPGLALEGTLFGFYHMHDLSTTRVFPGVGLIGYSCLSQGKTYLYYGAQSLVQYDSPYLIIAPLFGLQLSVKRFQINLEAKWYAPHEESEDRVVDYTLIPASQGAIGFVWGLSYQF